jgi:hypothetical protein
MALHSCDVLGTYEEITVDSDVQTFFSLMRAAHAEAVLILPVAANCPDGRRRRDFESLVQQIGAKAHAEDPADAPELNHLALALPVTAPQLLPWYPINDLNDNLERARSCYQALAHVGKVSFPFMPTTLTQGYGAATQAPPGQFAQAAAAPRTAGPAQPQARGAAAGSSTQQPSAVRPPFVLPPYPWQPLVQPTFTRPPEPAAAISTSLQSALETPERRLFTSRQDSGTSGAGPALQAQPQRRIGSTGPTQSLQGYPGVGQHPPQPGPGR